MKILKNKINLIDFITSLPVVIIILLLLLVGFIYYISQINIRDSYLTNSNVLIIGSRIDFDANNNLKLKLGLNLFDELKNKPSFSNHFTELELQRALLRKELKLQENLKNLPNYNQHLFDMASWYLITSGIKTNLDQIQDGREARFIASYYYFKNLLNNDKNNDKIRLLLEKMKLQLLKNKDNYIFYDNLTQEATKNYEKPISKEQKYQFELLNKVLKKKDSYTVKNLCDYYKSQMTKNKEYRKLGYQMAYRNCANQQ